jgi:uncharacterized protein
MQGQAGADKEPLSLVAVAAGGCVCLAVGAATGYAVGSMRATCGAGGDATVTDLFTYPIKGCGAVRCPSAVVTPRGLEADRLFMVTDFVGRMLTQRQLPAMATLKPAWNEAGDLILSAPNMQDFTLPRSLFGKGERSKVTVWSYTCEDAIDQGDAVGGWVSKALGAAGARLVRMPDEHVRPVRVGEGVRLAGGTAPHIISFADRYPFLLANERSLDVVREHSGMPTLSMLRFRPNIVIRGSGVGAWEEDQWASVQIGTTRFDVAKRCTRCQVPRIDPHTGKAGTSGEPTKSLPDNCFGQNLLACDFGSRISVGDPVTILSRRQPPPATDGPADKQGKASA